MQWAMLVALFLSTFASQAQNNVVSFLGDTSTRFNTIFKLSDGTFLAGGETRSLAWVPAGVPVVTLNMPDTTNSRSPRIAFIAHITGDMQTLARIVRFPANTVRDVFRIKTNTPTGQPTGDIYISGNRENEFNAFNNGGYYIAKLNGNFLNGNNPTGLVYLFDVNARGIQSNSPLMTETVSSFRTIQPWDVQSDGKIVYGTGHQYSASWAAIYRRRANGKSDDTLSSWPNHWVRISSRNPNVNGRNIEYRNYNMRVGDSILYTTNNPPGFSQNVMIDSALYSGIVLKVNRGGSNWRSYNATDFQTLLTDENGNPGRVGRYPEDFMYSAPCLTGNCPNLGPNPITNYGTNYGNNDNATHRVGGIVVDKRTNDMFVGYATLCRHPSSIQPGEGDIEPIVVGMSVSGEIKWWNRLHKEDPVRGSNALQEIEGLDVDYLHNQLVVLGVATDTSVNNFWKGNEITSNPAANGVQNKFTGTNANIRYAWIGKMNLNNGQMRHATYMGEYANNMGLTGDAYQSARMDGWPSYNSGSPNLARTIVRNIVVAETGEVMVIGEAERVLTTRDAFQKMPKQDQGLAPRTSFIRVYAPNLDSIQYSTAVTGIWDRTLGRASSNLMVRTATFSDNDVAFVGQHSRADGNMPTTNIPAFGDTTFQNSRGIIGLLKKNCIGATEPPAITGGASAYCQGESYTFRVQGTPGLKYVWAFPAGWEGNSSADSIVIRPTGIAADSGKVLVAAVNQCGASLPIGLSIGRPQLTDISIITVSSTQYRYNLPNNSAFWFINGDTARNAQGQAIRSQTLNLNNVVPRPSGTYTITAGFTNACGTFESNAILVTSGLQKLTAADVQLYPNPGANQLQLKGDDIVSVQIVDLPGKVWHQSKFGEAKDHFLIETTALPKGIYVVKVTTRNGSFTDKWMKE
jgi:hypothetical protein